MKELLSRILSSAALVMLLSAFFSTGAWAAEGALAKTHAAKGVTCAACHGQTKNFAAVPQEQCLKCHGDSKALAAKTANVKPTNPHENRHYGTEADCGLCHGIHKPSQNFCADCHPSFNFKVK